MSPLLPVYYQIEQTIKNWIINKDFNLGDKIPSENELAAKFGVNRLTVRQAISQLIREGFLTSKRGEGTFVTRDERLINSFNIEFTGFIDEIFYQVQRAKTKTVTAHRITAPKFARENLQLHKADEEIMQIKRTRFLGDHAFNLVINYLPLEIGLKVSEEELFRKPLFQIMEQDLGIQFTEAFQTIQASFADRDVAEKLGIPSGGPILFLERIMYAKRRKPVVLSQISYRGDLFKYIVRLRSVKRKGRSVWIHQAD